MPYLHGFEESLNNQGVIRKQTVKIHILVVLVFFRIFCFLLIKKVHLFKSTISGHLAQRRKSRDADIQFTRKLILHVPDVHMYIVGFRKA
jgi:hypothetical protein